LEPLASTRQKGPTISQKQIEIQNCIKKYNDLEREEAELVKQTLSTVEAREDSADVQIIKRILKTSKQRTQEDDFLDTKANPLDGLKSFESEAPKSVKIR